MKRLFALFFLLASLAYAQPAQQGNGQAFPPDKGPFISGQFYLLPYTATPMVPYASAYPNTATGTTQYFYWIVVHDVTNSNWSPTAGPFVVSNGPAALSSTASNTVSWPVFPLPLTYGPESGPAADWGGSPFTTSNVVYDVLETSTATPPAVNSTCTCAVVIGTQAASVVDTGVYQSYTTSDLNWPFAYSQEGDFLGIGPQGLIVDNGPAAGPPAGCPDPNTTPLLPYILNDATFCGNWDYDGGTIAAPDDGSGALNLVHLGGFNIPNCPSPGGTANNQVNLCNDYGGLAGGYLHWYDFINGGVDQVVPMIFNSTTGPTGINLSKSGETVTATLAGTGFGPAGGGHSVGIVPDPGATPHTPAYYLGDDDGWHDPTSISPSNVGGQSVTKFQLLSVAGTYGCTGDQNVCSFTLNWPGPFADANYIAVCNPENPTNTSGSESLSYGGSWNQTASQISVLVVANGAAPGSYGNFVCWGWHP